jgi:glycosyltransferase involved in cell wall biosynthesis
MRFSVVIPVYNVREFLPECLASVAASVRRAAADVECLAIDDGSTDGSGAWLDAAVRDYEWLRVVHVPNGGVSAARNAGLDAATGDWILFVDADDFVRETWLSDVCRAIEAYPAVDLVGFGKLPFYGGARTWDDEMPDDEVIDLSSSIPDRLVSSCVYQFAYRATLVKGLRFLPLTVGEDLVFVSEALARARSCVALARREYGYRYRENSASHTELTLRKLRDTVAFQTVMFQSFAASGKRLGAAFAEGRGRMWTEELPKLLMPRRGTSEGRAVWEAWLDSMSVAADLVCLPEAQRRRARRVASSRSVWSVLWNCRFPAYLRRKLPSRLAALVR